MRCGIERQNEWHYQGQIKTSSEGPAMEFLLLFVPKPTSGGEIANSLAFQVYLLIGGRWKCIYSDRSDTCDGSAALLRAWYSTDQVQHWCKQVTPFLSVLQIHVSLWKHPVNVMMACPWHQKASADGVGECFMTCDVA